MTVRLPDDASAEGVAYVPVQRKYLSAVYQFLGQLASKDDAVVPWPTEGEGPTLNSLDWTDVETCRRLRAHLRNPAALTMLRLTSENPGERVYLEDVMAAEAEAGRSCTHGQASSGNGAITKAIRMVFGFKGNWPAPFNWDKERSLAYYVMLPEVAEAWKAAADPVQ